MSLRAAGFVIFRKVSGKNEYLLLKASYGDRHWTPPKGHVDPGESDEETAYRETMEECGLTKVDLKVYENSKKTLQYLVRNKQKTVIYWLAELKNPDKQIKLSSEHEDYKWLDLSTINPYAKYSDLIDLIQYCDNFIKSTK